MMMRINYYIQRNEKYLLKFIPKKKKIEELTRKIDGNDLIFTILSTGDTIDFSQKKMIL